MSSILRLGSTEQVEIPGGHRCGHQRGTLQNDHTAKPTLIKLRAANGSAIDTYGERTLTLNIGMRRDFLDIYRGQREGTHPRRGFPGALRTGGPYEPSLSDTTTNLRVLGTPTSRLHRNQRRNMPWSRTFSKPTSPFVEELRHKMARLKYATPRQQPVNSYIPQHLRDCKFVFVRNDAVLRRTDKHLTIKRANSTDTIAIDRTKPAFLEKRQYDANPALRPPNAIPAHPSDAAPQTSNDTPATPVRQTRSGRRVTFPKDLRKYYY
ncbi:unnamed protein product [Acanthosepion pharaonis]|uniref:Uncharacterized protein n=1 Tax=Acanthosepion pharaonis TaxID=158019 RepID=A0A812DW89_ACAPH|nr:unnamed protein product [Sepia pharaonis]